MGHILMSAKVKEWVRAAVWYALNARAAVWHAVDMRHAASRWSECAREWYGIDVRHAACMVCYRHSICILALPICCKLPCELHTLYPFMCIRICTYEYIYVYTYICMHTHVCMHVCISICSHWWLPGDLVIMLMRTHPHQSEIRELAAHEPRTSHGVAWHIAWHATDMRHAA